MNMNTIERFADDAAGEVQRMMEKYYPGQWTEADVDALRRTLYDRAMMIEDRNEDGTASA